MKKLFIIFFICSISLFLPFFVFAEEYKYTTKVLIPVDTVVTVNTEKFQYQDFVYSSSADANGNCVISFGAIHNNTISKSFVSVNMLLFDSNKKNIGFLTYCTAKDVSSDYAGFKLDGNGSHVFSILVTPRYFVSGKSAKDVSYIAVLDENKYCQIGGYKNYQGLTIEQIINNGSSNGKKGKNFFQKFIYAVSSNVLISKMIIISSIFIVFVAIGVLLNELHMRMYGYKNILAYLPISDAYIAAKIVFGKIVAIVYFGLYVFSLLLLIIKVSFLMYIVNFILLLLICLTIVKLVTRKYNLFYLESSMNLLGHNSRTEAFEKQSIFHFGKKQDEEVLDERDTSLLSNDQPTLDLSYGNIDNSMSLEDDSNISSSNTLSNENQWMVDSSVNSLFQGQNIDQNSSDFDIPNLSTSDDKINDLQSSSSFEVEEGDSDDGEKNDFDDFF